MEIKYKDKQDSGVIHLALRKGRFDIHVRGIHEKP